MKSFSQQLRAFAELGRISNLPTTASNVLVGCAIARSNPFHDQRDFFRVLAIWIAVAMLYLAGMVLNDVVDVAIDRVERPNRPIPSGRVSRTTALVVTIALFALGLAIFSMLSWRAAAAGAALVALIVMYDFTHALHSATVLLMGACRGMVYIVAAYAFVDSPDWRILGIFAAIITIYTAL